MTSFEYWYPTLMLKEIEDVGDQNGQNRHQHLKIVTNIFCLQHRCSPCSVSQWETEKIDILGMVISVFHLPNMGGEKITLSISVLLALTFFLNLVSGLTPRNGFFSHWIISFWPWRSLWWRFKVPMFYKIAYESCVTKCMKTSSSQNPISSIVLQFSHKNQWDNSKKNFDRHSTSIKVFNVFNGFSFTLSYLLSLYCECSS